MSEVIKTGKTVDDAIEAACLELGKNRDEVSVEILERPVKRFFRSIPAKVKVQYLEEISPKIEKEIPKKEEKKTEKIADKIETQPVEKKNIEEVQKQETEASQSKDTVLEKEPEIKIEISENSAVQKAVDYLQEIFKTVGAENIEILAYKQGEATLLRVEGTELRELLDIRGETIQALSYLVDRSVNRGVDKKDSQYLKIRLDIEGYRNRREHELIALAKRTAEEVIKTKRSRTLAPMNPYERLIVHTTISEMDAVISESIGNDLERRVVIRSADAKDSDIGNKRGGGKRSKPNNRGGSRNRRDKGDKNNSEYSQKSSSAPAREFANKTNDTSKEPIIPKRREAISDGDDLPLYGKIEL